MSEERKQAFGDMPRKQGVGSKGKELRIEHKKNKRVLGMPKA